MRNLSALFSNLISNYTATNAIKKTRKIADRFNGSFVSMTVPYILKAVRRRTGRVGAGGGACRVSWAANNASAICSRSQSIIHRSNSVLDTYY